MAGPKKILVVDDSKTTLEVVKIYLMGEGYDFEVAHDAEEALRLLDRWRADIVISDMNMPGMDGVTFCTRVKARRAIPFIIVTAKPTPDTRRAALNAGVDGILAKPVSADLLSHMVRSLLGS